MDSLGLDYPARHLGTEFFWNNVTGGGVGPWFTNIRATPTAPNGGLPDTGAGSPGANIAANSAAISQLHGDLQRAVSAGFAQQGAKYAFSVPLENPLRYNQTGQAPNPYSGVVPPSRRIRPPIRRSSRRSATTPTRLEDEQAFFNKGIPGFTVSAASRTPTATRTRTPRRSAPGPRRRRSSSYAGTGRRSRWATARRRLRACSDRDVGRRPSAPDRVTRSAVDRSTATTRCARSEHRTRNTGRRIPAPGLTSRSASTPRGLRRTGDGLRSQPVGTPGACSRPARTRGARSGPTPLRHRALPGSAVPVNVIEGQPVGDLGDTIEHLNYFAGGAPHGIDGPASRPRSSSGRSSCRPSGRACCWRATTTPARRRCRRSPVAYFETSPGKPDSTTTVSFDASFARAADGSTSGLKYYWDFGDGTHATGKTGRSHVLGPDLRRREARGRQGQRLGRCTARPCRWTARPAPRRAPTPAARSLRPRRPR